MEDITTEILNTIYDFFVKSNDFNGIPLSTLFKKVSVSESSFFDAVEALISQDKVSVQFGNLSENPHIIRFGHYSSEIQIENLRKDKFEFTCIYPSKTYLKLKLNTTSYSNRPFSGRLALGEPHVSPAFFELDVLEKYFNDPRYSFELSDYSGEISIHPEFYESEDVYEKDKILLKSFGLGYDEKGKRVAVAYLTYLDDLSPEHQSHWASKEISSQCKVVAEYVENTVYGRWVFSHSLFSAFIAEQKAINELAVLVGKPKLFNNTFEERNRPRQFTFFLLPTSKNFEEFVLLLDKMISDNINKDFFEDDIELKERKMVGENEVEVINKGTLRLLDEWLRKFYPLGKEEYYDILINPFKEVRRLRQPSAHKINNNIYDAKYDEEQTSILEKVYRSMNGLRIILSQNPLAEGYKTPKWLDEGNIKKF